MPQGHAPRAVDVVDALLGAWRVQAWLPSGITSGGSRRMKATAASEQIAAT
jgi:hypothetical protein